MKVEVRWVAAAAAIVLTVVGMLVGSDGREATESSFGAGRTGYKALHDLFAELGMPAPRSYLAPRELAPDATVWWLSASQSDFDLNSGPCRSKDDDERDEVWSGQGWLDAGGTAVVFVGRKDCDRIAAFALPARSRLDDDAATKRPADAAPGQFAVRGLGPDRVLRGDAAIAFDGSGDWTAVASIDAQPLILERAVGRGRLVVVAGSAWLQNRWLATGDAAPFAVDLAQRYGVPLLDEHAHGFRPAQAALAYLASSPARGVFAGLCVLGVLVFWRGSLVPGKVLETSTPAAPALDSYVAALAGWYARTSDYTRVAERYRQYSLARLRRHLGLSAEISAQAVVERLQADTRVSAAGGARLRSEAVARSRTELATVTGEIDAAVRAVLQPRPCRPQ